MTVHQLGHYSQSLINLIMFTSIQLECVIPQPALTEDCIGVDVTVEGGCWTDTTSTTSLPPLTHVASVSADDDEICGLKVSAALLHVSPSGMVAPVATKLLGSTASVTNSH